MPPAKFTVPPAVFQLKITLKDSSPPIWRRVQVAADVTLAQLHHLIQLAFGWTDSHLHQFIIGNQYYSIPSPDDYEPVKDERRFKLNQFLVSPKDKIRYEYDFGDDWMHEVLLEKVLPPEPGVRYPVCVTGKNACPPEDVGGVWGYASFLEAITQPDHPEHDQYLEWIGDEFDPKAFDLEAVNQDLEALRRGGRRRQQVR
jgi:hypothetical protein